MSKISPEEDLSDLLGPEPEPENNVIKLKRRSRRPFQEWTYAEIIAAPATSYLVGDDERPILLEDALWQTMGLLKSGKTFYTLEVAFCVAFGLDFEGCKTKEGNVGYVIAEGGIKRMFERVKALCAKYDVPLRAKLG
jgi:hypothetical protein